MKIKALLIFVIILLLAGTSSGQTKKGQKAPDFTLPDLEGNNITLSEITGKGPIYINFWATWCAPCKKEIPLLVELYNEYHDRGFEILGISVDGSRTLGKVKSFVKNRKMNFPILLDSSSDVFRRKYKGRGIPYGFLLDNEGKIIHTVRGYIPGLEKTLVEKMEPYLISLEKDKTGNDKTQEESTSKKKPITEEKSEEQ